MVSFNFDVKCDTNATETLNDTYNFTCITKEENDIILNVLNTVVKQFQEDEYGIGLAFESESVIHKPKYIIEQIIIEYTNHSDKPLDYLAKGIALSRKGACFRPQTIKSLENYLALSEHQRMPIINEKPIYSQKSIYFLMADLYEKENQFEKSLQFFEKCAETDIDCPPFHIEERYATVLSKIDIKKAVDYLEEKVLKDNTYHYLNAKLNDYKTKAEKGYIFKPRKKSSVENEEMQQCIEKLALRYLK